MSARPPLFTRRFFVMCGFTFTVFVSAFMLFPTAPFRIVAVGGTKADAGLFLGFLTYASALSAPVTGALADKIGKRRMLLLVEPAGPVRARVVHEIAHVEACQDLVGGLLRGGRVHEVGGDVVQPLVRDLGAERCSATTVRPSATSCFAMAAPMPALAPVTTAATGFMQDLQRKPM